ncbi:NAD(P)-dependent alcohol dehydrogenase [Nakamurella lactea]|uniref:NAD(P)-dependent alcohol dehydrogenase n=1 Tax=Nakamurella lactea TaxID=459515 RepID=UPI00048BC4C3|nr:NAD(P)-dependent alcohol dehydrogenase [Nakamurella lactea]
MSAPTGGSTMRAAVLHVDRSITVEDRPVPQPAPGEVLIEVGAVGVCGSDVHYYRDGRIADHVVTGDLILGHEAGGSIVAVGAGVDPARVGSRVAIEPQKPCRVCAACKRGQYNLCPRIEFYATPPIDGAFCQYVVIGSDFAFDVADSVSDEAAGMLEPLSVGIAAARKARLRPGDRVLIAGAGPIGVIMAQTARAFGAGEVIVSDPMEQRRDTVQRYGATGVIDPVADGGAFADLQVDAFIDASGAQPAVLSGVSAVRPGGTVVLVGTGIDSMPLPIPAIQNGELNVTGIFRYTDTYPLAARWAADGTVELDSLVTATFGLAEVEQALSVAGAPDQLKVVVHPGR